ncbi:MAG: tRNA uridine-5-carboxymethylaminomethyl(34) synthesis GTPase MnmE [Oscillospiraceae bacterium]|nr:tRNA uridine-5-carboxymethylaminomethyl(34) synthesis GTPase MnmE [Oscillospiraceae bacterium]
MSTVCAIATPPAAGGISVIRISGERAAQIAARVFRPVSGKSPEELPGYHAAYGRIYDGEELLDDGVLLMFRAPHSYTGEDTAEISCHGGIYVTRRVLSACVKAGASPAGPGEFTKRALLNGKMSLTQAEAVADMISAQGGQLLSCANGQREGALYRRMEDCAGRIMEVESQISAWIDYPDDDTPVVTQEWLTGKLSEVQDIFRELMSGYDTGRMLREGISCAIVGKPNAGKSTLMNSFAGQQRSIVSDIEGTTRDIVEETVALGDIVLRIADCAGIRETNDPIEKIGVDIMLERLNSADIILAVFDGSRELSVEDERLLTLLSGRNTVAIVNKTDLPQKLDHSVIEAALGAPVKLSAKQDNAARLLEKAVAQRLDLDRLDPDAGFIANERQRDCLIRAAQAVDEALSAASLGVTPDAVGVMLEQALDAVYELSGRRASDEVIDEVFRRFCVGK